MDRNVTKAARLIQIEMLLLAHPEGLNQAEIARRLCVHRSSVNRYLADVPGYIYEDNGKIHIDRAASPIHVQFNLHEAMSIHVASRLLATILDRQNPHAASALRKLAIAIDRLAPHISHYLYQSADAIDKDVEWQDPNYLRALETLSLAWAERRRVEIWHRKSKNEPTKRYLFSTYYIEPGAVNRAVYVIGFREPPGDIRTFKLERIERIEVVDSRYDIPMDFDPAKILKNAWGVWFTGGEPIKVVLKFTPKAALRLAESRWHRSEHVEQCEDGGVLWQAMLEEPMEMLPWIRGWGADVEVIEPQDLRESVIREVQRMKELYHA